MHDGRPAILAISYYGSNKGAILDYTFVHVWEEVKLPIAGTSSKYINLLPTPSGLGVYLQYDESIYELTCASTSTSTTEIPETTTNEYEDTTTDNGYETTTASSTCIWK